MQLDTVSILRAQIKMKSNWLLFKTQRLAFLDKDDLKSVQFLTIKRAAKPTDSDEESKEAPPGIRFSSVSPSRNR